MKRIIFPFSYVITLLTICPTSSLCATAEETAIIDAVSRANLLKSNYRVAVTVNGHEAVLSAYLNEASKNAKTDMKIEAVLLAQKTMSASSHITRVKTRFYDLEQSSYNEVSVTTGDVTAFATGSLSQDKLLASLDVNVVKLNSALPNKKTIQSSSTSKSTDATPRPNLYKADGLAFYYPKTWVQMKIVEEGEQGRLVSTFSRDDATMTIRAEQISADSAAQRDKRSWSDLNANGTETQAKLGWNQSIQLGYSRKISGLDLLVQLTKGTKVTLERHIYFKLTPSSSTYHLRLRCNKDEFISLNKEFGAMLATVLPAQ